MQLKVGIHILYAIHILTNGYISLQSKVQL